MESLPITRKDLYQLLRQLSHDRMPEKSPLANLRLVRQSLEAAGLSTGEKSRHVELGRLLLEITESELGRLRAEVGRPSSANGTNHRARIRDDFSHGQRELEAWSSLYHVYLRPDLDLGLHDFAALVTTVHRRTIQRRLSRGVDALVARLAELERDALSRSPVQRATAHVPAAAVGGLVGIEATVNRAVPLLCSSEGPPILLLTGPGGIGKTQLARYLVLRAVESSVFQDIAWCSMAIGGRPSGSDDRAAGQSTAPAMPALPLDVLDSADRRPTVIVVDGWEQAQGTAGLVARLGAVRWPSKVVITSRVELPATASHQRLAVPPLDRPSSIALLRRSAAAAGVEDIDRASTATLEPLIRATGGHPASIGLAASMLEWADLATVVAEFEAGRGLPGDLYRDMWARLWHAVPESVQALVWAVVEAAKSQPGGAAGGLAAAACKNGAGEALRLAVAAGMLVPQGSASRRSYRPGLFLDRYLLGLAGDAQQRAAAPKRTAGVSQLAGDVIHVGRYSAPSATCASAGRGCLAAGEECAPTGR